MLITATISIVFLLICFLFFYFKQDMVKTLFNNQLSYPTSELQDQLALTADQVIKNLESHITHLEDLLDEADERIDLLDHKIKQAKQILPGSLDINNLTESQLNSPHIQKITLDAQVGQLYGVMQYQQQSTNRLAVAAIDTDSDNAGQAAAQDSFSPSFSQQRSVIIAMFKQGYTPTDIAKATGFGKGEILLFLQLHNKE